MKTSVLSELGQRTTEPPISWLMRMTLDQPKLISLAAGFTDSGSLPVDAVKELLGAVLKTPRRGRAALQYGTTVGDHNLRKLSADHLRRQDDGHATSEAVYDPDRMLVTNGSQQLLYMVSEALCNPGDIVLVEDPTYFVYLGIAQSHGVHCRGIATDHEGVIPDALERVLGGLKQSGKLSRVKMLYLVTYFQNPSGTTTTDERKAAALKILRKYEGAAGHPIFLIEDAAYRELRFSGEDIPSALTRNPDRVVYVSTYSKPFASGMRVGYSVVPDDLRRVLLRIKGNHDFGTSNLVQQMLAKALASGIYGDHLRGLRSRYARKANIMVGALKKAFPGAVEWQVPKGGLYVWAGLPRRIRTGPKGAFFQKVLSRHVLYVPGEFCFADDPARRKPASHLRLSFGGAREHHIREGIRRLGHVIRSFMHR